MSETTGTSIIKIERKMIIYKPSEQVQAVIAMIVYAREQHAGMIGRS